jgi:Protein of unknown function (DUF2971)
MADFPPHFFKYRSLNNDEERERVRRTILHHEIYWAAPSSFNDPFDCAPIFEPPPPNRRREVVHRVVSREMPNASRRERRGRERELLRMPERFYQNNLDRLMPQTMQETGVYSVANRGDDILMWSHYGGSHSGVCLRFRPGRLLDVFQVTFPIRYSAERPRIVVGLEEPTDQLQKLLLTKADFWRYEGEWRFIGWREHPGVRILPADALDGIILGARISDADAERIRGWVEARAEGPIEILRASLDRRLFRIDVG